VTKGTHNSLNNLSSFLFGCNCIFSKMEAYICLQYDAYQNWFWGNLMVAVGALHYT
jgi:hypothetical protein